MALLSCCESLEYIKPKEFRITLMLIHDLSHFEILSQTPKLCGGIDSTLNMFLAEDGRLSLIFGDQTLYSTTLISAPKQLILSLDNIPGFILSSSTQNVNGKTSSILTVGLGKNQTGGIFSFASSSTVAGSML
jgi:hypothetical protein